VDTSSPVDLDPASSSADTTIPRYEHSFLADGGAAGLVPFDYHQLESFPAFGDTIDTSALNGTVEIR